LSELGEDGFDEDGLDNQELKAITIDNPFSNEQLLLCSQQFFAHYPLRQKQALQAGWDMVIVDEAHHLAWSEQAVSPEYMFVESLAIQTPSLILLTATPEQLGKESHFARLRLLDPDRFYSFAAFLEEERQFEPVANAAKLLLADEPLDDAAKVLLTDLLKDDNVSGLIQNLDAEEKSADAREHLIKILLDHHGTGRILFRNSRQTVQGFPERERFGYALPAIDADGQSGLLKDPRYGWLVAIIKQWAGQKALLICKEAHTAIELEQTLKNRAGIASAVFHEGMTIIERDRAAAYFADQDSSARLLICSEIGSEGRNFQFVHQLVLWDLPGNPDLLQQRIGRLDRIGQKHIIQIHIPYWQNSAQAVLYRWYDEGMDAFRHNCSAAQQVADILKAELAELLASPNQDAIDALIDTTRSLVAMVENQLHNGRDQLLELNSCRKESADALIRQVNAYEKAATLWPYMEELFECYGVETEFHSLDSYIIRPGDQMRVAHFPELPEDGVTVTVSRSNALAREELKFLTWEHPMVLSAMELVLTSETGNAVISVIRHPAMRAGQFLLECLFVVECSAPVELQIGRFLPATPIRVLIDQNCKDLTETIAHSALLETGTNFDKQQIIAFLNNNRAHLGKLLTTAEEKATLAMGALIAQATQAMLVSLSAEIKRLVRLKKVNPTIKAEEIEQLKDMTLTAHENIQAAQLRLDAVRFVITS
jgi:ATP-dependent helicase HepA